MRRTLIILGWALLWSGCTESTTLLGPGDDTTQSLIINFGETQQPQFPDSRSVVYVSNASVRQPQGSVTVSDVRFSTIIREETCESLTYTAVALDDVGLNHTANAPSELCSTVDRYTLQRRNAPFYGPVRFRATHPGVIADIDTEVSLLPENAITNVQSLQAFRVDRDLTLTFRHPVDPLFSKLYLFEATLEEPETLTVRFTEPATQVVIPADQLQRLQAMSSGLAFTITLQEAQVEENAIPLRAPDGTLLTFIDVWNTNTYSVEVILSEGPAT